MGLKGGDMYVPVADIELHCRVEGAGEPILLIHGFPLSSRMWSETVANLPSGFQFIMPDLRGHGESPASEVTSMGQYAADLVELLARVKAVRPVVVVGHSMGGYIAFDLVRQLGDRVRALVLVNSRASHDTQEQAGARRLTAAEVLRDGMAGLSEEMAEKLFSPTVPDRLRREWKMIMRSTSPVGAAAALRAMADRDESFSTLRGFERPLLVVAGSDDRVIPAAEVEAMRAVAPRARIEVLDGSGHMTPVEQPGRFSEILADFLLTDKV
jgi:3-oxoadipate enol-lactonase